MCAGSALSTLIRGTLSGLTLTDVHLKSLFSHFSTHLCRFGLTHFASACHHGAAGICISITTGLPCWKPSADDTLVSSQCHLKLDSAIPPVAWKKTETEWHKRIEESKRGLPFMMMNPLWGHLDLLRADSDGDGPFLAQLSTTWHKSVCLDWQWKKK